MFIILCKHSIDSLEVKNNFGKKKFILYLSLVVWNLGIISSVNSNALSAVIILGLPLSGDDPG